MQHTRFFTLIILIILFLTYGCSTSEEKKEKHYLRALEYVKMADEKAAILELRNAIQLDAKFADARYQLGLLYLKTGDPQGAFSELQRAFSIDPKNADAGVKVAEFHLLAKNRKESRSYIEQVLKVNPDYPDAVALLANLDLVEGNLGQAEQDIDKAIRLAPTNDKYHNIRGHVLCSQKRWKEGEEAFNRAIELSPDSFANYRTLLGYYEEQKDKAASRRLLDIMTPKFPNDPQLYLLYAELYEKEDQRDKAEQAFLQAIQLNRKAVSFRLKLVDFYKSGHQTEKAEEYLKTTLTELSDEVQLQTQLAELLFDSGKFAEARQVMDAIIKTNPGNGAANLLKARFLIRDGKNDEAIDVLTPLTTDYPKWGEPFYYTALARLKDEKIELAQRAIQVATQNSPGNDRYHTLAAQINLLRGNGADAGKEATIALQINRENFPAVKLLAQALLLEQSFDKTIRLIESLDKKIVDEDDDLLGALGMAYLGQKDKKAAMEAFNRLLTVAPDNTRALSVLTALTAGKDLDRAIVFVKNYLSSHETASHYILLGELYARNRQNELALNAFEKAQNLNPGDPQAYILYARLLNRLGKTEESIARYNELLTRKPRSIPALMGLAIALENGGRTTEAMNVYKKVLDIKPDFPAAANNLAWLIAFEGGDLGEALRLAMQAKQALPDQPNIADTLGWVHYKRESYNLAISQFKLALAGRPDDPTFSFHLALAEYANGEKDEARKLLQGVVDGNKEFNEREEADATLRKWRGP